MEIVCVDITRRYWKVSVGGQEQGGSNAGAGRRPLKRCRQLLFSREQEPSSCTSPRFGRETASQEVIRLNSSPGITEQERCARAGWANIWFMSLPHSGRAYTTSMEDVPSLCSCRLYENWTLSRNVEKHDLIIHLLPEQFGIAWLSALLVY